MCACRVHHDYRINAICVGAAARQHTTTHRTTFLFAYAQCVVACVRAHTHLYNNIGEYHRAVIQRRVGAL